MLSQGFYIRHTFPWIIFLFTWLPASTLQVCIILEQRAEADGKSAIILTFCSTSSLLLPLSSMCKFLGISSAAFIFSTLIVSWCCFKDSRAFSNCSWVSTFLAREKENHFHHQDVKHTDLTTPSYMTWPPQFYPAEPYHVYSVLNVTSQLVPLHLQACLELF